MTTWTLYVTTPARVRTHQVTDLADLTVVVRRNAVGKFVGLVPGDSAAVAPLTRPGADVQLWRDGVAVFGGRVRRRRWLRDADRFMFEFSGFDHLQLLADRVTVPEPLTQPPGPYGADSHHVTSGPATAAITSLVRDQAAEDAVQVRKVPGLTAANSGGATAGADVTIRTRWRNLLEECQRYAAATGVVFTVTPQATSYVWRCVAAPDRTGTVRFAPDLGTVTAYDLDAVEADATYAYVGGGGEGTSRTIAHRHSDPGAVGRREVFVDQRQTTDTGELATAGDAELAEHASAQVVTMDAVDVPGQAWAVDYQVGDLVACTIAGQQITSSVEQVQLRLAGDAAAAQVTPTLGARATGNAIDAIFAAIATQGARLRNLEASP